ncbi:MAG: disaggregatase related repeat-containing protein [Methanosarcina sp.]
MSPPTIYVAGDGSGDFNCDGTDDHVQINQALACVAANTGYTTVHLKGPFTYVIDNSLLIGSNTILEGDRTAVLKLADHAGWNATKPLIQQMNSSGNNNIVVRGFEVNANYGNNTEVRLGAGYYNIFYFLRCNNVKVYNMYMHNGHGDGLRIRNSENIQFYNNIVYKLGHDGMFAIECKNVEAWNNKITCRTNSGLRVWNSNNVKLYDNAIDSFYPNCTGGPGIQVEKSAGVMDNIEIYSNIFNNTYGPGIWLFNYDTNSATRDQGKNVYIHHNIFYGTGTNKGITWVGGIIAGGFNNTLIENNVFDGTYNAAIAHMYMPGYSSSYCPPGGYITTVRNNIIVNTVKCKADPGGGYGIINGLPETHCFVLQNNCLYNNIAGSYKNCASTTDICADPLFADRKNHDYHLKSKAGRWEGSTWVIDSVSSPCIDAGYPLSDYSKEPEDNGDRINIGRYGNTICASKSNPVPKNTHAPVIVPISNCTVKVGDNLNFTVTASDADGDNLTYSASGFPAGASLNSKSGFFTWTPAADQEGMYRITFNVSDGIFNDSEPADITVTKKESSTGNNSMSLSGKVYDNRLREASPKTAFGKDAYIDLGGMSTGRYRDIMWFNLSGYTDASKVNNANLSLVWYYPASTRPNDTVIEIYRPASAWDPGNVSWNMKNNVSFWNNPGGDWYDKNGVLQGNSPYATLTINASSLPNNTFCELNVTQLVREYAGGKYTNTGILIKARTESNNYIAFYSSECGNTSRTPKLNINYK